MLLKLWLDNVLIWLLLISLQENTHTYIRAHTQTKAECYEPQENRTLKANIYGTYQ